MVHLSLRRLTAVLTALAALACNDGSTTAPAPSRSISLDVPAADVFERDVATLRAAVRNADGTEVSGAPITWSVSDTLRANVSPDGVATFFVPGTVTVTARSGSLAASRIVDVRRLSVQLVTILPTALQLGHGDIVVLGVRVQGEGGRDVYGRQVSITSDDPATATNDASGRVRGVAPGTTTVRAMADGVVGSARVEVRAANAVLSLARVGGTRLPMLVEGDYVSWNGVREYHEYFIEGGDLILSGGTTPRYAITVKYAQYHVTGPADARTYTLRATWKEADFGVVEYDPRGDLRMISEYISPLSHSASGVSGGMQVRFRIPGDNSYLDLLYRRE